MSIFSVSPEGYRGEAIDVRGVVYNADRGGIAGLIINVFLMPPGDDGTNARQIGVGLSDDKGEFTTTVTIPTTLATEKYEVYVATPGNSEYRTAVSE